MGVGGRGERSREGGGVGWGVGILPRDCWPQDPKLCSYCGYIFVPLGDLFNFPLNLAGPPTPQLAPLCPPQLPLPQTSGEPYQACNLYPEDITQESLSMVHYSTYKGPDTVLHSSQYFKWFSNFVP